MFKKILVAIAVVFPMLAAAQTIKIGVVDSQKIIPEMAAYKTAMTELEAMDKKYKDEYMKLTTEAQKKYEEFQALAADTPAAVKERRAKELDEFSQKLAEFEQMYNADMAKQRDAKIQPVMNEVMTAIQAVGKEGGYSLIQDAGAVLYYGGSAENITDLVKARLGVK